MKDWVHELRKNGTVDMVIAIAGNKCDLEDLREVRTKGMRLLLLTINLLV